MNALPEADIEPSDVTDTLAYHAKLNSAIWGNQGKLKLEVRVALLKAAKAFLEFLNVPDLRIEDIILTGSNCSFNYTRYSDLDVHLIVDFDETVCPELAENLFGTKKALWGQTHSITVKGIPVELYVEDSKDPVTALGVYSLLRGEWIRRPKPGAKPKWSDSAVAAKADALADEIDTVDASHIADIDDLITRIRNMRRAGLARAGEFSTENLAYKVLRNLGFIDKLYQARIAAEDRALSLESATK